jgi:L,D-transpeptidase catalytic domain
VRYAAAILLFVLVLAAGVVAGAWFYGRSGPAPATETAARAEVRTAGSAELLAAAVAPLPASARPAFDIDRARPLDGRKRARFAPVARRVIARNKPWPGSRPIAVLGRHTEEDTTNIVLILGEAKRRGKTWVQVRLPVLPNGRTGWVPRSALGGYAFVRTRLVVDRARLTATLYKDGRPIFRAPVGIGTPASPTPSGEFFVRLKLAGFDDPFYGPVAFGTNARSAVLTDWPGGGYIGIHGTNAPALIPGRVSHGCVRLRNKDVVALGRLLPVGTPLTIR